jgi:hypothetical protein
MMTLFGGEEYAFHYTRLSGEFIRTGFETSTGTAEASEYFAQGVQTLTARWFAAGRFEGASAPPPTAGAVHRGRTDVRMVEATAGFGVNPAITLRSSYYTRCFYTASAWDQQFVVSMVWAQRWR